MRLISALLVLVLAACVDPDFVTIPYETGARKAAGRMVDGLREGTWSSWFLNGQQESHGRFVKGKKTGPWTYWHENGQRHCSAEFKNNKEHGDWTRWHDTGQKHSEARFQDGNKQGPRQDAGEDQTVSLQSFPCESPGWREGRRFGIQLIANKF